MKDKGGYFNRPLSYLFVSGKLDSECRERLSDYFSHIVYLRASAELPIPVASHADMLLFALGDTLLSSERYLSENADLFAEIKTRSVGALGDKYPSDVLLDALPMGKYLFCRKDATAKILLDSYEAINVHQGYARCSCVKIAENALITADRGIASAAYAKGVDALLISPGGVTLDGYSCGFIGGASVLLCEGKIGFFGDIDTHPDSLSMREFAAKYQVELVSLGSGKLKDMGSAVAI